MKQKNRGWIFLLLGVLLVAILIFSYLFIRQEQKNAFDKLYNTDTLLIVNYGIITQPEIVMEKNSLFKRVHQDNHYFLRITSDYTLFTYYLDTYYAFDPMRGYNLVYNMKITEEIWEDIIKKIEEKENTSLVGKIPEEHISIIHDNKNTYIKKEDFHLILQDNDIVLDI